GTNDWRAGLWEFNRDDALQAKNFFAASRPRLKQNQFGGAAGGPLRRNRLFLFGYVEAFQNTEGQTDTRTRLSAAERPGDFSQTAPILDPQTGAPFPGNIVPPNRIDPIARTILDAYVPLPNASGNRVVRSPSVEDARRQGGLRIDYRPGTNHNLFARYLVG